ncbi:DNA-binding TFAR19-related protein [Violaceomyces palustris]|uniref:DNA-binding TFAR19-related protein n=1 Tax=Violaceomyces palustris TaxID=1673888 RepID=A0ACD0NRB9_9BASI|nr:DNA-binding TFAR19-related protein [Violaceomyces palustris]
MEEDELAAIRAARMAELRGGSSSSSSGAGGMGGPPFSSTSNSAGETQTKEDQMAQQEEMKRQMLSRILDGRARERLSRIALVKPQKSKAITDLLIRMAQSGQVRQTITEDQLIGLLDQVDHQQGGANEPKITFTRKKSSAVEEDQDSDFDI